jgi:hypothetical protein
MAPIMQKAAAGETACARAVNHGAIADAFVQDIIKALEAVNAVDAGSVRAEFAARLAVTLSKVTNEEGTV